MSYENLFNALEDQIEAENQQLVTSAKKKAGAIIRAAQREVERLNKQLLEEAAKKEEVKQSAQVKSRGHKASKLLVLAKREFFQQALKLTRKKLSELPQKPEYSRVLKKLIQEATAHFPECTRLQVNARDTSLAQKILGELRLKLAIESTQDFSAGVIASSADGRMSIYNTLESRLARLIPLISPQVATILYG
jgi:vacuolar-type H+-ATPase subunit E/Vma4